MVILFKCKNEGKNNQNERTRVVTILSHSKSMGIFSDAQGQLIDSPTSDLA